MPEQKINLTLSRGQQLLQVSGDTPGIEPIIEKDGTQVPLHGSIVQGGDPIPIGFRITNYLLLYNAVQARTQKITRDYNGTNTGGIPKSSAETLPGVASFVVTTSTKKKTSFVCSFALMPPGNIQLSKVGAAIGGNDVGEPVLVMQGSSRSEAKLGEMDRRQAYDPYNVIALKLTYFISAADGSAIAASVINGATVAYDVLEMYPALGTNLLSVNNAHDRALCNGRIDAAAATVPIPNDGAFSHEINLTPATPTIMMSNANPFEEADRLVIRLRPTLRLSGTPAISALPSFLISIYQGACANRDVLNSLLFQGAEWNPVRGQSSEQSSLDRFGFLRFVIKTEGGVDVATSVYDTIKRGSLAYASSMSSGGTGTAQIGSIPLNGTSFGTGQLFDRSSNSTVYLRTRMYSLVFDRKAGGLVLTIEVNATHRSGMAAQLYSQRFWEYVSEAVSASLQIPAGCGVAPPTSWVK